MNTIKPTSSNGRFKDLTGQTFGRLTVIEFHHTKNGSAFWVCNCSCGQTKVVKGGSLLAGTSQSCGCLQRESHPRTHNMSGSPEYRVWNAIKNRCTLPNNKDYPGYGGRGIVMCERWLHSFENFYTDMGPRPSLDYTIERIDNDGPYAPDNCRWATRREQNYNKRNSRRVSYNGETRTIAEWASLYGISYTNLFNRLAQNWTIERALTTPVIKRRQTQYPVFVVM